MSGSSEFSLWVLAVAIMFGAYRAARYFWPEVPHGTLFAVVLAAFGVLVVTVVVVRVRARKSDEK
ncbi:hypothetical protein [Lentzea sp. NPDC051838]|uniref:hypothetical protein n=1 Tax=Lentzea sp. NPDC051838 TaxID=3154849 RepID=UPI003426DB91